MARESPAGTRNPETPSSIAFAVAADVGGDDRQARGERLHDGDREPLVARGQAEEIRGAVQVGEIGAGAEEPDLRAGSGPRGERLQLLQQLSAARHEEAGPGDRGGHLPRGGDQHVVGLVPREPPDRQDHRARGAGREPLAQGRARLRARGRGEVGGVDAVVERDALARADAGRPAVIVPHAVGHGDHRVAPSIEEPLLQGAPPPLGRVHRVHGPEDDRARPPCGRRGSRRSSTPACARGRWRPSRGGRSGTGREGSRDASGP